MDNKIIITPKTKVGDMLDSYPELEKILFEVSPAFSKLKNPVLRKTVAKVASLQQAAVIGNIKVDELVNRLREAVGQDKSQDIIAGTDYLKSSPDWFDEKKVILVYDARPIINSGGSPMKEVFNEANLLNKGTILNLITPFVSAPIIDKLKDMGFLVYTKQSDPSIFNNYIYKSN